MSKDTTVVYIYTLSCPKTGEIRYVGQSKNPEKRLKEHRASGTAKLYLWIHDLLANGDAPVLEIVEQCDVGARYKREMFWIKKLQSEGHPLLNHEVAGQATNEENMRKFKKMRLSENIQRSALIKILKTIYGASQR